MVLFLTFAIISNVTFSIYTCLKLTPVILILNSLSACTLETIKLADRGNSNTKNGKQDIKISDDVLHETHLWRYAYIKQNLNCGILTNAFKSPTKPYLSYWEHMIIDNNKDGRNQLKWKKIMAFLQFIHNLKPNLIIR